MLPENIRRECKQLKVAIDLNAVPPAGIAGITPHEKAAEQDGQICYGAIGVGGLKMKLHKAAIRRLSKRTTPSSMPKKSTNSARAYNDRLYVDQYSFRLELQDQQDCK